MGRISRHEVVAVLGRGVTPPDTPVLPVTDRGVLHGDGLFEMDPALVRARHAGITVATLPLGVAATARARGGVSRRRG